MVLVGHSLLNILPRNHGAVDAARISCLLSLYQYVRHFHNNQLAISAIDSTKNAFTRLIDNGLNKRQPDTAEPTF